MMAISLIENDAYVHAHDDCIDAVQKKGSNVIRYCFFQACPAVSYLLLWDIVSPAFEIHNSVRTPR